MNEAGVTLLHEEEGVKTQPYWDSLGFATFGVGRLCDPRKPCPIPLKICEQLFGIDYAERESLASRIPGYSRLNSVQQAVLISMVYQLGFEPFDGDGVRDFRDMLAALRSGDVKRAAVAGRDSKWHNKDTPARAERQMRMLETGLWVPFNAVKRG
jgi:GH24 family phage-related lysozyme (muramidase)